MCSGHSRAIVDRLFEDPVAELAHQAALLGHRQELGRRDRAELGVLHAGQGLEARETAALEIVLRLEVHREPVVAETFCYRLLKAQPNLD